MEDLGDRVPLSVVEKLRAKAEKERAAEKERRRLEEEALAAAAKEEKRAAKRAARDAAKRAEASAPGSRTGLPITLFRKELVRELRNNQCVVVVGATGSGKTTQLPQYVVDAGLARSHARVACTQPRRIAAQTVAARVASERDGPLGREVGYAVRFDDKTSKATRLVYQTDGLLVRECLVDRDLSRYDVVILDEAHERTVMTDVLFGLVKDVMARRPAFKVVVMSATLDAELFSRYFGGASVFTVPGRQWPVDVLYLSSPEADYVEAATLAALQVNDEQPPGDAIVFLTGHEEIESVRLALVRRQEDLAAGPEGAAPQRPYVVCPVYGAQDAEQQALAFAPAPAGTRKIILATNIAETSVTIPGVRYVIDTGLVKARGFQARSAIDSLLVMPVSKAQANQRAGRAGREAPGKCFRLYTEDTFDKLAESTTPEIRRCSMSSVILTLMAIGIKNVLAFDFLEPPPMEALEQGLEALFMLGAVDKDTGELTSCGKLMARYPLEPTWAKLLVESGEQGCARECITAAAMLTDANLLVQPGEAKREAAGKARQPFHSRDGDHGTLINIYNAYIGTPPAERDEWCRRHFLHARNMKRVIEVRRQLEEYARGMGIDPAESCGADLAPFRKCLAVAFQGNAAQLQPDGTYRTLLTRQTVEIHPSSVVFKQKPKAVIYNELVMTSKLYIRDVTAVERDLLVEISKGLFR
jgi:HrpA-like RNA helicase